VPWLFSASRCAAPLLPARDGILKHARCRFALDRRLRLGLVCLRFNRDAVSSAWPHSERKLSVGTDQLLRVLAAVCRAFVRETRGQITG